MKIKKYRSASSQSRQFIRFSYFENSAFFLRSYLSIRLGCWLACKWKERLSNTACKSYTRCRSNAMSNELENANFPFRSTRPFERFERSSELENWAPVHDSSARIHTGVRSKHLTGANASTISTTSRNVYSKGDANAVQYIYST